MRATSTRDSEDEAPNTRRSALEELASSRITWRDKLRRTRRDLGFLIASVLFFVVLVGAFAGYVIWATQDLNAVSPPAPSAAAWCTQSAAADHDACVCRYNLLREEWETEGHPSFSERVKIAFKRYDCDTAGGY